jgi:hypothetical protein
VLPPSMTSARCIAKVPFVRRIRPLHFTCFVLAIACGRIAEDTATPPVTEDELPRRIAEAICTDLDASCRMAGFSGRSPTCVETRSKSIREGQAVAQAAGAKFDSEAARRCIDAIRKTVTGRASLKEVSPAILECAAIYPGATAPVGAPCTYTRSFISECATTAAKPVVCVTTMDSTGTESTCAAVVVAGNGEGCLVSADVYRQCVSGSFCRSAVCEPRPRLGEPCGWAGGDDCASGATCDFRITKRCVAPTPVGGACTTAQECETWNCVAGRCVLYTPFADETSCAR